MGFLLLKVSMAAKEPRHKDTWTSRLPVNGSGLQLDDLLFTALLTTTGEESRMASMIA